MSAITIKLKDQATSINNEVSNFSITANRLGSAMINISGELKLLNSEKQNKNDPGLNTNSKDVVSAINELKTKLG